MRCHVEVFRRGAHSFFEFWQKKKLASGLDAAANANLLRTVWTSPAEKAPVLAGRGPVYDGSQPPGASRGASFTKHGVTGAWEQIAARYSLGKPVDRRRPNALIR